MIDERLIWAAVGVIAGIFLAGLFSDEKPELVIENQQDEMAYLGLEEGGRYTFYTTEHTITGDVDIESYGSWVKVLQSEGVEAWVNLDRASIIRKRGDSDGAAKVMDMSQEDEKARDSMLEDPASPQGVTAPTPAHQVQFPPGFVPDDPAWMTAPTAPPPAHQVQFPPDFVPDDPAWGTTPTAPTQPATAPAPMPDVGMAPPPPRGKVMKLQPTDKVEYREAPQAATVTVLPPMGMRFEDDPEVASGPAPTQGVAVLPPPGMRFEDDPQPPAQ